MAPKAANLFEEQLSGPEVLARVDAAILKVSEALTDLKTIRAGLCDLEGMDPQTKPVEPVKKLLLYFDHQHKQTFKDEAGEPIAAVIAWGKDNAIMKRIREAHGDERTEKLIDAFFAKRDMYCEERGYTVQTFSTRVAGLVAQLARSAPATGVTQRTASNARNGSAAVAMIQQQYGGR